MNTTRAIYIITIIVKNVMLYYRIPQLSITIILLYNRRLASCTNNKCIMCIYIILASRRPRTIRKAYEKVDCRL